MSKFGVFQKGYAFGTQRSLVRIQSSRSRKQADSQEFKRLSKPVIPLLTVAISWYIVLAENEDNMTMPKMNGALRVHLPRGIWEPVLGFGKLLSALSFLGDCYA